MNNTVHWPRSAGQIDRLETLAMHRLPLIVALSVSGTAAAFQQQQQFEEINSCAWSPLTPEYQLTCPAPFSRHRRAPSGSKFGFPRARNEVDEGYYYELSAGHDLPDPWEGPEQCHAGFCLFSNPEAGGGLSLITTPRIAHLIATSKEIPESTGIEPEAFYEAEVPGKGSGLIANRTIRKGEVIMQRGPVLLIQSIPHIDLEPGRRLELYQAAVDRLPESMRSRFLRQTGDTVYDKVEKNSFRVFLDGNRKHSIHLGLFPDVSKFNHDCRPNVHYRISDLTHTTVAVRDIPAGEELTISYIYGLKPRAERLEQLSEWGFTCTCPQCALSEPEAGASDNRIRQIKMLEDEIEELVAKGAPRGRHHHHHHHHHRNRNQGRDTSSSSSSPESGGQESTATTGTDTATAETAAAAVLRPELGARLVELYREERLDAYLAPALTRAALLYSMFGHEERAREYAREAVGALEREKGPRAGDLGPMRALARDPKSHWSWAIKVTSGDKNSATAAAAAAAAAAVRNGTLGARSGGEQARLGKGKGKKEKGVRG
ncbi:hypothetical protein VTG60DRAFT_3478 [Thermothelomyces hinnuleus]